MQSRGRPAGPRVHRPRLKHRSTGAPKSVPTSRPRSRASPCPEHLAAALRLLFPSDDARRAEERARWCHRLKHKHKQGTPWRLWRWLRDEMDREDDPVSSWARTEIEKHAEYVYNQREWMKYPKAVEAEAALGSGPVEAACKTLVTQRLKVSGASWSREGAGGVLYLRSLLQSDRFEHGFAFRQATRYAS